MSTTKETQQPVTMSVGTGIAIAGIWLAASLITLGIFAIVVFSFIASPPTATIGSGAFVLLAMMIAPLIAAWTITVKILNKD